MHSLAAETITKIGFFPITNSVLDILVVDFLLIIFALYFYKKIALVPGTLQAGVEILIYGFYNLTKSISPKNVDRIFPYCMTFFIFILAVNWSGLIPGFSSIGFFHGDHHELIPLLRGGTSDINVTLGLALVSVIATHYLSIDILGIKEYLGRYFSKNPINLYVGIIELGSEITKIVSLSFRLFGNILAGEIVLATISSLFAFIFPLPFLLLEVLVGVVQALVFCLLTMVFMSILTTPHHANHAKEVIS